MNRSPCCCAAAAPLFGDEIVPNAHLAHPQAVAFHAISITGDNMKKQQPTPTSVPAQEL